MLKNSKIGIFLMIVFFLSACGENEGENNSGGDKLKTNNVHFNTSVTAIKSATTVKRTIRGASIYTGTLSVKDLNTKQTKTYEWYANLNTDTFELNSTTTITLTPSDYEITLLLTKGKAQYVGKKAVTIRDEDSINLDFVLSPVIGDVVAKFEALDGLMNFKLNYDVNDFSSLSAPNMSLGVDNDSMVNFKINSSTGFSELFMNIPEGKRTIKLKLFDGHKQVAKATETVLVEYDTDINIDIIPLKGDLSLNFNVDNSSFDVNLTIPKEVIESTGSIANTKSVIKILSDHANGTLKTKEFNIVKSNGVYQAYLSFTDMKVNSTVSVEVSFFNKNKNKLVSKMTIIAPQNKKVSTSLGVYSEAGLGGNVLASLSMNIQNTDDEVLSGALVYLDDIFIGHSNYNGYLSTTLTKGIHYLTFKKDGKLIAARRLRLRPLEISNIFVKVGEEFDDRDLTNPFKIIVKGRSFAIKLNSNYNYNYDVDCNNDGKYETTFRTSGYTCKYTGSGTHTIAILGNYPHPQFSGNSKIVAIKQWGNIAWKSMRRAFYNTPNLKTIETDVGPDLSNVTDLSYMFWYARAFNANLSNWDVSNVTNMYAMFRYAYKFNSDLSSWNTSSVTNMHGMFESAKAFDSDISNWDVSNVTDMSFMFYLAYAFDSDISNWNVSNVTNMRSMFSSAYAFDSDISNWDVSNVTNMNYMFYGASAFSNKNLSAWDVSNVTSHWWFSDGWGVGNTAPKFK
jgi:surface protein